MRTKTVTIAILLCINVIFLAVIIIDTVADARSERQALIDVCTVLSNGGIILDPGSIRTAGAISTMRTARDLESEVLMARAALGDVDMTDQGVISRYESEGRGVAEFSSTGNFEIRIGAGVIMIEGNAVKTVEKLLRSMRIETSELYESGTPGDETVIAVCAYNGASIFNCAIEFSFIGDSLEGITGKYITGVEPAPDGSGVSPPGTVLLGFLASVKRGDVDCSVITEVEAGYHHAASSFGIGAISPAWQINTDTGKYVVDDATGEILSRS